ncbi:SsrA-binding protein SmpB [Streptomyces griseoluteus]|uniref:SsrA-binding protein SmpB n=1 Tax=Streptomyces griseoluteus TaxID=29306 RepID=UPI0036C99EE0
MSKGMYVPKESQPKQGGAASAKGKVKDGKRKLVAQNKKARHDYAIIDTYEAGMVLSGTEVKSLRQGRASLTDGFVQIDGHEAWLHNAHIPEYSQGTWTNHSVRRKRKLLLHREEIDKLEAKSQETGHTIVPLALYFKDGRAKAEIALARGKKEYDKRQTLREKQDRRESDRAIAAAKRKQRGD